MRLLKLVMNVLLFFSHLLLLHLENFYARRDQVLIGTATRGSVDGSVAPENDDDPGTQRTHDILQTSSIEQDNIEKDAEIESSENTDLTELGEGGNVKKHLDKTPEKITLDPMYCARKGIEEMDEFEKALDFEEDKEIPVIDNGEVTENRKRNAPDSLPLSEAEKARLNG
uniref:Uncharacterized protein n=1 Tax=Panagrolaimus superbus TaxID=310955 RepID=A0A914XQN3_9BILA